MPPIDVLLIIPYPRHLQSISNGWVHPDAIGMPSGILSSQLMYVPIVEDS